MPKENNYNDLVALKGPDQVRLRPGVIFGSDSVDGCNMKIFGPGRRGRLPPLGVRDYFELHRRSA